jgi:uncharacterized membrane protein
MDTLLTDRRPARVLGWAGFLLGFALGGFFDGIVLHQGRPGWGVSFRRWRRRVRERSTGG